MAPTAFDNSDVVPTLSQRDFHNIIADKCSEVYPALQNFAEDAPSESVIFHRFWMLAKGVMSYNDVEELEPQIQKLCKASIEARKMSYSPYSQFKVGAALLCSDGTVFSGCNVENASYGLAICAERTAATKAVSENHREFISIAIAADLGKEFVGPCGACRQFLAEFNHKMPIYLTRLDGKVQCTNLEVLLPEAFTPDFFNQR